MPATEILFCPCCASAATADKDSGSYFQNRIVCSNPKCGVRTPAVRTLKIALIIWNKRPVRKPPKRVAKRRIP